MACMSLEAGGTHQVIAAVEKQLVEFLRCEVNASVFRNVRNFFANGTDLAHTPHLHDDKNVPTLEVTSQ